jgi:hypothetical protein
MDSVILSSKVVGYSRGKKVKNPYRARLIELKNGEYGVAIDEKIGGKWGRVPSGWSLTTLRNTLYLPQLNKFLDQVFLDYGQGWSVQGMSGVLKEATKLLKRRGLRRNETPLEETPLEQLRRYRMMRLKKPRPGYEFNVQGYYAGRWEDVDAHDNRYDAIQSRKNYDENEPGYSHRVIARRIKANRRRGLRRNPLDSMRVYAGRDGFEITDFKKGDRIEMHPATDLWMRGARYGEIVQVGRKNLKVKLDYLRRAIAVSPRNIGQIVSRQEIL